MPLRSQIKGEISNQYPLYAGVDPSRKNTESQQKPEREETIMEST